MVNLRNIEAKEQFKKKVSKMQGLKQMLDEVSTVDNSVLVKKKIGVNHVQFMIKSLINTRHG